MRVVSSKLEVERRASTTLFSLVSVSRLVLSLLLSSSFSCNSYHEWIVRRDLAQTAAPTTLKTIECDCQAGRFSRTHSFTQFQLENGWTFLPRAAKVTCTSLAPFDQQYYRTTELFFLTEGRPGIVLPSDRLNLTHSQ